MVLTSFADLVKAFLAPPSAYENHTRRVMCVLACCTVVQGFINRDKALRFDLL